MMDNLLSMQALMWARRAAKAAGWSPAFAKATPASSVCGDAVRCASSGDVHGTLAALAAGSDPMAHDADGINAMMWAAFRGDALSLSAMIDLAILGQADPKARDGMGANALMRAALTGRAKCVSMLIPFSEPNAVDASGLTALAQAAQGGHSACVKLLISFDDPSAKLAYGRTALMEAAAKGRLPSCEVLCQACDPRAVDNQGFTAAQLARQAGHGGVADVIEAMVAIRNERDALGECVEDKPNKGSTRL